MPTLVRPLHVKLHESAGQLLIFPGRRRLARTQPHDRVIHPDSLPGLQRQVANDPVTLVQKSEDGDTLSHRGNASDLARPRTGRGQPCTI